VHQHHAPARKITAFAGIRSGGVNDLAQMDLLMMGGVWAQLPAGKRRRTDRIRYLLTYIDVYSRFAMAIPLATKDSEAVRNALVQIHSALGKPKRIECDEGPEFHGEVATYLEREHISLRRGVVGIHRHQAFIESWHRTLEQRLIKYMRTVGAWRWLEALDRIVGAYNTSMHSGIRAVPADVFSGKTTPVGPRPRKARHGLRALKPGDHVRYAYDRPEGAAHRRAWDQVYSDDIVLVEHTVGDARGPRLHYLLGKEGRLERPYYREELRHVEVVDSRVRTTDA
jgi:hypothetical protein